MAHLDVMDHIVIAGGGIGGLALGIALRRHGIRATVLERATTRDGSGSGLVLAPNGMKALAALGGGVAADVRAAGSVSGAGHESRFVTARGRTLSTVSFAGAQARWGAPVVSLRRARLHEVLLGHATRAGVDVRTGVTVTGYTDHGATVRAGGVDGDLLVGADGYRSAVRRQLLGDGEPTYRGYTAVRGIGPVPAAFPHGFIAYGRGLILFCAPVDGGQVYWVASITAPAGRWPAKGARAAHRDLLALLAGWHPDLVGVVAGADPDRFVLTDIHDRDPVDTWHRGRVVLLGDAAHPMTYTMGQGANTTLEDAVTLAHHVATGSTVGAALSAYTAQRAPRTAKIVRMSRMMGAVGQTSNPVGAWLRDRAMSVMGRFGDPDQQNADVFGWQAPAGVAGPAGAPHDRT